MTEQKKYHSVERYGKSNNEISARGNIVVWEKLDGCFHYNSRVMLADGTEKKIGQIVKEGKPIEVISLNTDTGEFEAKKVVNFYNHGKKKKFIGVKVASVNGGRPSTIYCTPDHEFLTNKGWVEAKDLNESLVLYTAFDSIDEYQKQLLLGTAFGDSYIYPKKTKGNNRGIVYSIANKFPEYKKLKDMVLGDLFSYDEQYVSGFGSDCTRTFSKINLATEEVLSKCFVSDTKKMNEEYFKSLTPVGLAFWYQDDGSLTHNDKQLDRARLNTQCLSLEENELLQSLFLKYLGLSSSITKEHKNSKDYYSLNFNTESSENFFSLISPYIVNSMRYKLPEKFKNILCFWDEYSKEKKNLVKTEVNFLGFTDVAQYAQNTDNYDIEVEDNHNYIVNGVVVHNSNASFKREGNEIKTFSRNQELTGEDGLGGFRKWALESINVDRVLEGYIYFGEWMNRHKIDYGEHEKKFFLYDVYDVGAERYLGVDNIQAEAFHLGLDLAPIFYEGEYISEEHLQSFVGKSMLAPDGVGEGVVVKNYGYFDKHGNQHFTKIVSKHFQEISGIKVKEMKSKPDVITQFIENTVTPARIEKMLFKLVDEGKLKEDFAIEDMGTILKLLGGSVYEDVMKEEADVLHKAIGSRFGKAVPAKVRETLMNMGRA